LSSPPPTGGLSRDRHGIDEELSPSPPASSASPLDLS
jgi:hypothetical protein